MTLAHITFLVCVSYLFAHCTVATYSYMRERLIEAPSWYFWKFIHNGVVHPFLALPWEPKWAQRAHDWTAQRCKGGG